MKDRIKSLRTELGYTQEEFAKKLGLARNSIANYEIGRREPTNAIITSICREFNVNEDWLRNGTEPMHLPEGDKLESYLAKISKGNDAFIKEIIEVYMELDECSKQALKKIAEAMAKKHKERER